MSTDHDFDFSDVSVDGVREILDVAVDVLRDYGNTPGDSRIERLARWVLFNLRADVQLEGSLFTDVDMTPDAKREIGTYWFLNAEQQEH